MELLNYICNKKKYRTVIAYKHYFEEFLEAQEQKVQLKILQTLRIIEEVELVPILYLKHIEATDGNIAKMTAYALAYVTGQLQPEDTVVWNTKEDETVNLNQAQIVSILNGLGQVQAIVWSVKYPAYVQAIDEAETVEEVENIIIDYTEESEGE